MIYEQGLRLATASSLYNPNVVHNSGIIPGQDIKMNDKIKTESEYDAALSRAEELWNAELGTPEGEELDKLVTFIEEYEFVHYPMDPPSKEAAVQFRREQSGDDYQ